MHIAVPQFSEGHPTTSQQVKFTIFLRLESYWEARYKILYSVVEVDCRFHQLHTMVLLTSCQSFIGQQSTNTNTKH